METLYDRLEVSEKASKEVIEKAYKVLAKKYHPDLQTPENKANAEQMMKLINEAYEILSDDIKRQEYDRKLEMQKGQSATQGQSNTGYKESTYNQNTYAQHTSSGANEKTQEERYEEWKRRRKYEQELKKQQEQMKKKMEKEYQNAYYSYLRRLGYKVKEGWTWEKTKKLLILLLVLTITGIILWLIPPTRKMMIDFYNNNILVKIFVNIIMAIIKAIVTTIQSIFGSIFGGK